MENTYIKYQIEKYVQVITVATMFATFATIVAEVATMVAEVATTIYAYILTAVATIVIFQYYIWLQRNGNHCCYTPTQWRK